MKSGNLNFLERSWPLQACNGTALPYIFVAVPMLRGTDGSEKSVVYIFIVELITFKVSLYYVISVKRNLTSSNSFVPEDTGSCSYGILIPTYNSAQHHKPS
jgi:hypothetical protein